MDEKHFEHAEALTDAQRLNALQSAHDACTRTGQAECDDCGEDIPRARRAAFPAAIRCIHCQTAYESSCRPHRRSFF